MVESYRVYSTTVLYRQDPPGFTMPKDYPPEPTPPQGNLLQSRIVQQSIKSFLIGNTPPECYRNRDTKKGYLTGLTPPQIIHEGLPPTRQYTYLPRPNQPKDLSVFYHRAIQEGLPVLHHRLSSKIHLPAYKDHRRFVSHSLPGGEVEVS
jgi:hypothetical protein